MKQITTWVLMGLVATFIISCQSSENADNQPRKIEVLFLGHDSEHHNSEAYAPILASALADDAINFTYTEDPNDLNDKNLAKFDALLLYANHDSITTSQEQALLDFVANGKGFIPIHSASYCFRNSDAFVELVGAQFQSHETGTFTASIVNRDHPVTDSLAEFETWDETYVHTMHNQDRTVLMERDGEPWTWVRTHGDGKVFYTAYGHDERTWENPGFHELVKEGIVWSVSDQVQENWEQFASTMPELTYEDRETIPNYEQRDPAPRFQLPLSPEESQKFNQVPPGYEVELFASEPDIINPIDMAWDEQGRLWVIETIDYPNTVREEDGVGDDKIKILEDTNNDGQADKVTVFADSLNIPTSLVFANGGVIVSQAPHFLFLQDTDGDDKADVRRTIMSGWGTRDTHAGPSNLMYGFDNQIWGVVGYSGFEGVVGGDSLDFNEDIYRFNTDFDNLNLEVMTNTSNNTWGLGFSETFDVFASTANNTHAAYMGIPMRYYENYEFPEPDDDQPSWRRQEPIMAEKIDGHYAMHPITRNYRQVDVFGGFTAAAGFQFYTARQFPQNYWNRIAFISEPTGGLVHQGIIEPDGASFTETDAWNIFASHDEWTSPVAAKVGPDGSLWVLDWYNFIIQHNPTPSVERGGYDAERGEGNAHINPLRDRSHGRIYRITYKENGPSEPMTLSQDNPDELVEALGNDNMFWRLTAQRLLVERGETDVLPELYELVQNEEVDEMGLNSAALHALWTIHGLGALDGNNAEALDVAIGALDHPASGVRKSAIKALPSTPETNQAILDSGVLNDEDGQARLWAMLSTIEMPSSPEIGEALYDLSQDSTVIQDEWLAEALKLSADVHQEAYRQASTAGQTGSSSSSSGSDSQGTTGTVTTEGDVQTIRIQAVMNELAFDITNFTVEAGKKVEIIFENPDFMQHNLLIVEPGSLQEVGEAADALARSVEGPELAYIPEMEEILFATPLLSPEQTYTLSFTAPETPGDYPYLCTFPGHWRSMQGVMTVAEDTQTANL